MSAVRTHSRLREGVCIRQRTTREYLHTYIHRQIAGEVLARRFACCDTLSMTAVTPSSTLGLYTCFFDGRE